MAKKVLSRTWSKPPNPDGIQGTRKKGEESCSWAINFPSFSDCKYKEKDDNTLKNTEERRSKTL